MEQKTNKLPMSIKIGYGLGAAGDSIPYNLFFTYFLFYLTDIAGIHPAIAGTILFISVVWDAVTDPVAGYLSDVSKNPKGRRRPWMAKSILPLALVLILIFLPNNFTGNLQIAYYTVVAILLWTFFTTYCVPYGAFGAEITQDYNERNNLRLVVGIISYILVAVCNAGPMFVIGNMMPRGYDIKTAWMVVGIAGAIILIIMASASVRMTRGQEIQVDQSTLTTEGMFKSFFTMYKELIKIRIYRILIVVGFIYLIGFTIFNATGVYVLTHVANLNPAQQGTFWVTYTFIAMACTPLPILVANKVGKKPALLGFSVVFILSTFLFYFVLGLSNFALVIAYATTVAFGTSAFWGLYYSFVYDVAEVDEYINGKRREGGILALAQFFQKFGGAVATSLAGIILGMVGYTGSGMESAETIKGILMIHTILPGIIILVSMLFLLKFPLNKAKFDAIKVAIEARNKGEEYSTEAFKDCI